MENSKSYVQNELAEPGPSGMQRELRSRSSSSSSDSSQNSSSSSSSSSAAKRRRSHYKKKRRGRKRTHSRQEYRKLSREVRDLRKSLYIRDNERQVQTSDHYCDDSMSINSGVSRNLYEEIGDNASVIDVPKNVNFNIQTKLKEPSMPKSSEHHLKLLCDLQHWDTSNWNEIRYSETQKAYNHKPGFTDIEINEEVAAFQSPRHLLYADKAFAALTMCILKQKESLQKVLLDFGQWSKVSTPDYEVINNKLLELINCGDFQTTSADLLQLVCGHRAEILQMRRDCVIKQVKEPLVKSTLRKIPPTHTNLFNADKFTAALEKAGGVRKCFWPLKKSNNSTSQVETHKTTVSSQEYATRKRPSQGCQHGSCHVQGCCQTAPPPQGGYNYYSHGHSSHSVAPNNRGLFRGRGSSRNYPKQRNQSKSGQKRAPSPPNNSRDVKRRKY